MADAIIEQPGEHVMLNGMLFPVEQANRVIMVHCTMLGKSYTVDMEADPNYVHITIDGYVPHENDAKVSRVEANNTEKSTLQISTVNKCGKC